MFILQGWCNNNWCSHLCQEGKETEEREQRKKNKSEKGKEEEEIEQTKKEREGTMKEEQDWMKKKKKEKGRKWKKNRKRMEKTGN